MAENAAEVAKAYVAIIPSMEGAQQQITEDLTGATAAAASKAGESGGKSLGGSIAKGLDSVGSTLTKGITVPVTAAATASIAAWKGVDEAMDTVTTKTGASGAALEDMQNRAKSIATTIPASFQEAGDAIGEVNTRFGLTGDSLESLSTDFIKFAQLNNQDVSGSVDNVSKVLAAFGMDASEASGYLDALNVVGQKTGVDVGTLAQQVSANAAQFQQMGLSAADATNLLGQMSMAGLDSSTAMMGMKTAMKSAAADGVDLNTALSTFKETMSSNASESDKLAAAYELFGTRAGGAIYNAVSQGTLDLTNFSGSLTGFSGSVSTTFDETLDPLDQFTVTMNSVKEAGAGLVDALGPTIQTALTTMTDAVKGATDAWNSLSPATQDNIIKLALAAAAIGPVIAAVSKAITVFNTIKQAVGAFSTALGLASAGPVVLIGAAIAATILLIVTHFDEIKTAFGAVADFFSEKIEAVKGFFDGLGDKISGIVDGVKSKFDDMKNGAKEKFDTMKDNVSQAMDGIKQLTGERLSAMKQAFEQNGGGIKGTAAAIWAGLKTAWQQGFNIINNLTGGKLGEILGKFKEKMDGVKDAVKNALNRVKEFFSGLRLKLPDIKLPHFKLTGSFSLKPPSVPHLAVDWYAKAAEQGAIFDRPQIIGVGDATQPEALLGVDTLKNLLAESNRPNNTFNIYASQGMDVNELAEVVMDKMQTEYEKESAALT